MPFCPVRCGGAIGGGIDLEAVHEKLNELDELRLKRRFDDADALKRELFDVFDIKVIQQGGRRQFRLRRGDEDGMDGQP